MQRVSCQPFLGYTHACSSRAGWSVSSRPMCRVCMSAL